MSTENQPRRNAGTEPPAESATEDQAAGQVAGSAATAGTEPAADSAEAEGAAARAEPPRRRVVLLACVAAVALLVDILTKVTVVSTLEGHEPVKVLGGLVYLQLIRNPGAAFGMATGLTWVFAVVAIGVVVALVYFAPRLRSAWWAFGLGLVLAGALGNLVDRVFRAPGVMQGHVIDFISVFAPNAEVWPIFNVADSCICVGGVLIVLLSLIGVEYDGTRRGRAR